MGDTTDKPVFVVRPRDPRDESHVRHIGPGASLELRGQADRPLPQPEQPKAVDPPPGVRVIDCGRTAEGGQRVIGPVPDGW